MGAPMGWKSVDPFSIQGGQICISSKRFFSSNNPTSTGDRLSGPWEVVHSSFRLGRPRWFWMDSTTKEGSRTTSAEMSLRSLGGRLRDSSLLLISRAGSGWSLRNVHTLRKLVQQVHKTCSTDSTVAEEGSLAHCAFVEGRSISPRLRALGGQRP